MDDYPILTTPSKRSIWVRGLMMILMSLAFQLAATLLACVAIVQFAVVLVGDEPNTRMLHFGKNLGQFLSQIAAFVSFSAEELPFPFSDWPSA